MAGWNYDANGNYVSYTDDSGNTQTLDQVNADRKAKGLEPIAGNTQAATDQTNDPNGKSSVKGTTDLSGATDGVISDPASVPGGTLDTANADAERSRTEGLLAHLQQQAATGDGAWEDTLHKSILNAQGTASALGQSQANTGGGYASALRNIGNAQSSAAQRGAGEGNILRAETQQNAASQLGDLYGTEGNQDLAQATGDAAARQGVHEANQALAEEGQKTTLGYIQGGAQAATALASLSDGGMVPGEPSVFGDDSRNDTVPAMLSPKEIVVPISAAKDPDKAAAFARAVASRHAQHFAGGGQAWQSGEADPTDKGFSWMGLPTAAPSIQNGGLLSTSAIDQNRAGSLSLADELERRAAGNGPSVAPQMLTNAQDDTIEGTMQGQQQARASNDAALLGSAVTNQQHAGANAARQSEKEAETAGKEQGNVLGQQRARDIATVQAQQQTEWRNTLGNIGVSLENQRTIQGLAGAAGQGAVGLASALSKRDGGGGGGNVGPDASGDTAGSGFSSEGAGPAGVSGEGDFPMPEEGAPQAAAFGGEIEAPMEDDERARVHNFLRMLTRRAA